MTKRITKNCIEWRIRNLPYPIDVYSVTTNDDERAIIVRTTNKKYFKRISIPELVRCELLPDQQLISIRHQYNTLIITVSNFAVVDIIHFRVATISLETTFYFLLGMRDNLSKS